MANHSSILSFTQASPGASTLTQIWRRVALWGVSATRGCFKTILKPKKLSEGKKTMLYSLLINVKKIILSCPSGVVNIEVHFSTHDFSRNQSLAASWHPKGRWHFRELLGLHVNPMPRNEMLH